MLSKRITKYIHYLGYHCNSQFPHMKAFLVILLLPFTSLAQSQKDYDHVMASFKKAYNHHQPEKVCELFPKETRNKVARVWNNRGIDELYSDYGKIVSYKYLGRDKADSDNVAVYRAVFQKKTIPMSLSLDKDKNLENFRLDTHSDEIDEMMKKEQ